MDLPRTPSFRLDGKRALVAGASSGIGRGLAEFLLAGGHDRTGHIAGWDGTSTQRDREAGFLAGLAAAGRGLHSRGVGNFRMEEAHDAAREMFAGQDRPDAVFVANDHLAFAVMDVLRAELGLRVPQDASVVGYDDVPPAAWAACDLTTVRQRANLMEAHTVGLMLGQIQNPGAPARAVTIEAPPILRGSARIPEGWRSKSQAGAREDQRSDKDAAAHEDRRSFSETAAQEGNTP